MSAERRVQGMELEKLRYRWAAMNPAANGDHDNEEEYLGAEPLDPALADRFGFLIEVPDWSDLSEAERIEVLLDQFRGPHEFPVQVAALVERSIAIFRELCARPPTQSCGYFLVLESQLRGAGTRFSSRRMTTLLRTSLGIASRIALCIESGEKSPRPEWQESLFLALAHGHPGLASGPVDCGALLAMHRQAWNIAGSNEDVNAAVWQKPDALVGVEVAVNTDCVFVHGRIACGPQSFDIEKIARAVKAFWKKFGYRVQCSATFRICASTCTPPVQRVRALVVSASCNSGRLSLFTALLRWSASFHLGELNQPTRYSPCRQALSLR